MTIDTEEEFDWHAPASPKNRSVGHVAQLPRLQQLFESLGVRPTYVVDEPIATTPLSRDVFAEFLARGTCEVGAHCHPWVNPPIEEELTPRNTYLCNLPLPLQERKLTHLTDAIERAFGRRPTTYKAGRYGLDFALAPHLRRLGYTVDTSIIAYMDLSEDEGPDFGGFGNQPFRLGPPVVPHEPDDGAALLEIPCTVGFSRHPYSVWSKLHKVLSRPGIRRLRGIGALWHSRILRKVVMTPEGNDTRDLTNMIDVLGRDPDVVLNMTLHSPSIEPGHTPYVRTASEREEFLARLQTVLEHAQRRLSPRCLTLSEYAASLTEVRA